MSDHAPKDGCDDCLCTKPSGGLIERPAPSTTIHRHRGFDGLQGEAGLLIHDRQ